MSKDENEALGRETIKLLYGLDDRQIDKIIDIADDLNLVGVGSSIYDLLNLLGAKGVGIEKFGYEVNNEQRKERD